MRFRALQRENEKFEGKWTFEDLIILMRKNHKILIREVFESVGNV